MADKDKEPKRNLSPNAYGGSLGVQSGLGGFTFTFPTVEPGSIMLDFSDLNAGTATPAADLGGLNPLVSGGFAGPVPLAAIEVLGEAVPQLAPLSDFARLLGGSTGSSSAFQNLVTKKPPTEFERLLELPRYLEAAPLEETIVLSSSLAKTGSIAALAIAAIAGYQTGSFLTRTFGLDTLLGGLASGDFTPKPGKRSTKPQPTPILEETTVTSARPAKPTIGSLIGALTSLLPFGLPAPTRAPGLGFQPFLSISTLPGKGLAISSPKNPLVSVVATPVGLVSTIPSPPPKKGIVIPPIDLTPNQGTVLQPAASPGEATQIGTKASSACFCPDKPKDTERKKKYGCRQGYFRETSGGIDYTTWSTRKCPSSKTKSPSQRVLRQPT